MTCDPDVYPDRQRPPATTRRALLRGGAALGAASLLQACAGLPAGLGGGPGGDGPGAAALLLPLSGESAALGARLEAAARLGGGPGLGVVLRDSGSTAETAVAAARAAVDAGAQMLVGPLFGAQTRAVRAQVPRGVPVVTLSNDATLAGAGTFVFGVTPSHSARAVLALAAQRGIGDVAIVVPPGRFGEQTATAARAVADTLGLRLRDPVVATDPATMAAGLRAGGGTPSGVYLPAAGPGLAGLARAVPDGVQIMGSAQWATAALEDEPALRGAWFAAPDPLRFAAFAAAYAEATGEAAGIVAGLVYDGVQLARTLGAEGRQDARGLTREGGFSGVLGPCRFDRSGLAERGLAVLEVGAGDFNLIGATSV